MEGLSEAASEIIDQFSRLELLKEYQLIGGSAISLQINHRISEDLDFCKWVADSRNVKYAVNAKGIYMELSNHFKKVEMNHLGFSQVNFYIEPGVKITFYHTHLKKPKENKTINLIGNIVLSNLDVLGGSKIYVLTQRTEIRDYYDIYVLLNIEKLELSSILSIANNLSGEANARKISKIFSNTNFTEKQKKELDNLKPVHPVGDIGEFNNYFKSLGYQIEKEHTI